VRTGASRYIAPLHLVTRRVPFALAGMLALLSACERDVTMQNARGVSTALTAITVTDEGGRVVTLARPAQRVVSLMPSITESIVAIGAAPLLVGRTRYDTDSSLRHLPSVGGSNDPSLEVVASLTPDLVIVWNDSERAAIREQLTRLGIPTFAMRAVDTADVLRNIGTIARLLDRQRAADSLLVRLRAEMAEIADESRGDPHPSVFFLLWNDPPLTASPATFIGQLISLAGGRPLSGDAREEWPTVSIEEIVRQDPDIIIVPVGEMRPASAGRLRELPGWRDLRAVRTGNIFTIPADLSNRPGPHVAAAARILRDSIRVLSARSRSESAASNAGAKAGGLR
jgi:iron complex transport system substrate-binding protein